MGTAVAEQRNSFGLVGVLDGLLVSHPLFLLRISVDVIWKHDRPDRYLFVLLMLGYSYHSPSFAYPPYRAAMSPSLHLHYLLFALAFVWPALQGLLS